MEQSARYAKAISRAEKVMGSRARLAALFQVPPEQIQAWLDGEELAPLEIFLRSLDVIADGPYAPVTRPIRVAVIDPR